MQIANTWKVSVATRRNGEWKGRFLFKPTSQDVITAITGDITDGQREMKQCDRGDADEVEYYQERLRQLRDVAQHATHGFANTQAQKRVLVAGTLIGTIQVTHEQVFAK